MNRAERRAGGYPPISAELERIRDQEVDALVRANLEDSGLSVRELWAECVAAWYGTLNTRLSPPALMDEREARGIGDSEPDD